MRSLIFLVLVCVCFSLPIDEGVPRSPKKKCPKKNGPVIQVTETPIEAVNFPENNQEYSGEFEDIHEGAEDDRDSFEGFVDEISEVSNSEEDLEAPVPVPQSEIDADFENELDDMDEFEEVGGESDISAEDDQVPEEDDNVSDSLPGPPVENNRAKTNDQSNIKIIPFDDDRESSLSAHNDERAKFGIEPLEWDDELEHHAFDYAVVLASKQCEEKKHSWKDGRLDESENLHFAGGNGEMGNEPLSKMIINGWNSEPLEGSNHHTQVVWRGSHRVGCAKVGVEKSDGWCQVGVCRYSPPGNSGGIFSD